MNGRLRLGLTVLTALAILATASVTVLAEDQDRVMLQDQTRLMEQISRDRDLSPAEIQALTPQLQGALRAAGSGGPVRSMVRTAYDEGCRGECLSESVRLQTRAMDQGYSAGEAHRLVQGEIRSCLKEKAANGMSDEELRLMLQTRVEAKIATRTRNAEMSGRGTSGGVASGEGSGSTDNSRSGTRGGSASSGGGSGGRR